MLRAAIIVLLLPGVAAADPADTVEGQQRALALSETSVGTGTWHLRAFLEETDTAERTWSEFALGAGVDLAASTPECDLFRIGGAGRFIEGQTGDAVERHASAETWASGCFHLARVGVVSTTMQLGHHLEWDVRPALLAPLGLHEGDNRRETISIDFEPGRFPVSTMFEGSTGDVVIFDVTTDFGFVWQRGGVPSLLATSEASPFRFTRARTAPWGEHRDLVVDVFAGGGEFTDDAAAIGVWALRVQNAKLGPLYTTAGIGITSASAGPEVAMYEQQIELTRPRVLLGIEGGDELIHAHLRATEEAQVTPDGAAAIDQRLSGGTRFVLNKYRVGFDASIGRTDLHVPDQMPVTAVTGGATGALAAKIGTWAETSMSLTYARSFYADGATLASPRWGAQLFVSIRAVIDR